MSYDRAQVAEAAARMREKRMQEQIPALRTLQAQAVVMTEFVTGDERWDKYLSYLQSVRNNIQKSRDSAHARQNDPAVWEPQALAMTKSNVLQAEAMLQIMDLVMQLPKALIEDGERAKELISTFEKSHGTSEQPDT